MSSIGGNISARVLSLAATAIMARSLGPLSRGVIAAAMVWPTVFVTLGALVGVGTAAYFSARKGTVGLQACLAIALVSTMFLLPVSAAVNDVVFRGRQEIGLIYADVFLLSIPIVLVSNVYLGALLGRGKIESFWLARVGGGALLLICVLGLALLHRLSMGGYIVAAVAAAAGTLILARYFYGPIGISRHLPKPQMREVIGYSARVFTTTIPAQLHVRLDQLVLSIMLPLDQLGMYAVAQSWASAVSIVAGGLATVIVSRTVQVNPVQADAVTTGIRRVSRASLLAFVIAVTVAAFAPIGLPLVFGHRYQAAVIPAVILSFSSAFAAWKSMLHDFSRSVGRPQTGSVPEIIGLVIAAAGLFVLVPILGTRGAASAALISQIGLLLAFAVSLRRLMSTGPLPVPRLRDLGGLFADAASYAKYLMSRSTG